MFFDFLFERIICNFYRVTKVANLRDVTNYSFLYGLQELSLLIIHIHLPKGDVYVF